MTVVTAVTGNLSPIFPVTPVTAVTVIALNTQLAGFPRSAGGDMNAEFIQSTRVLCKLFGQHTWGNGFSGLMFQQCTQLCGSSCESMQSFQKGREKEALDQWR